MLESRIREKEEEVEEVMRQQAATDLALDNLRIQHNLAVDQHQHIEKNKNKLIHQLKEQID